MPQIFKNIVLTEEGAALLAKAEAGEITMEFTSMATGDGSYSDEEKAVEKLRPLSELKSKKNKYDITKTEVIDEKLGAVKLTALISNFDTVKKEELVTEGYYINELGVYAREKETEEEKLYAIAVTDTSQGDYMPAYKEGNLAQIMMEFLITVDNVGQVNLEIDNTALAYQKDVDKLSEDISQLYTTTDRLYTGVDLEVKFAAEIAQQSGADAEEKRWNWIKGRIDKHDWTGLHVGDYLKLKVKSVKDEDGANTGETKEEEHLMQIAGIDSFYETGWGETHGTSDTTKLYPVPHHIDFISKDLLSNPVQWNTTEQNYNSGTGDGSADDATDQPYYCSHVRKYLLEKVLPTINTNVASLFTEKLQIMERRAHKTDTALTESTGHHWYNLGKLWLPTEFEVYGARILGSVWSDTQAVQYPIFAGTWLNRIKHIGPGGDRGAWWLACAMGGSSTYACVVGYTGAATLYVVTYSSIRVPVCFRIAASSEAA